MNNADQFSQVEKDKVRRLQEARTSAQIEEQVEATLDQFGEKIDHHAQQQLTRWAGARRGIPVCDSQVEDYAQ